MMERKGPGRTFAVISALILAVGISAALAGTAYAEKNVSLTLYNTLTAMDRFSNKTLMQPEGMQYGGVFDARFQVSPSFEFSDRFQSDCLVDVYLSKPYNTNALAFMVKEAYIDLLFYGTVSFKNGFVKADFGYNSFFHPLNVVSVIPGFSGRYRQISEGGSVQGFEGVPGSALKLSFSKLFGLFNLSLSQTAVWSDFTNMGRNYQFSALSIVWDDWNFGFEAGYTPDLLFTNGPFTNGAVVSNTAQFPYKTAMPAYGLSLSLRLPFDLFIFSETLFRTESYRFYTADGVLTNYRDGELFVNSSLRLQYAFNDPFWANQLSLNLEYFYNGEGFGRDQYTNMARYLDNPARMADFTEMMQYQRMGRNYLYAGASYGVKALKLSFDYWLVWSIDERIFEHDLRVSDQFSDNVTASAGVVYYDNWDQDCQMLYGANRMVYYLFFSYSL